METLFLEKLNFSGDEEFLFVEIKNFSSLLSVGIANKDATPTSFPKFIFVSREMNKT